MEAQDLDQYITGLQKLAVFFDKPLTEERMALFLEKISLLAPEQFNQAIEYAMEQCVFFPVPAQLFELVGVELPTAQVEQEASVEWLKLRRPGCFVDKLNLSRLVLRVVNEMGGRGNYPSSFGNWPVEQEPYRKKEFLHRYLVAKEEMGTQVQPPPLPAPALSPPSATPDRKARASHFLNSPSLVGLSDHEKGQRISKELLRRFEVGERVGDITSQTFDEWQAEAEPRNPTAGNWRRV